MSKFAVFRSNPALWLVILLPLAAVIAGISTVVIATRNAGNNDMVAAKVRRTAQVQQADLRPDMEAARLRLSAQLRTQPGRVEIVPGAASFPPATRWTLAARHPMTASGDRLIPLTSSTEGVWTATVDLPQTHDWVLELSPSEGGWRLQGRLPKGQRTAQLAPAVGP